METTILLTDTHFGVKNNSMTWLHSQMDFVYNQLIPFIKEKRESMGDGDTIRIIHLGDVFDSRSSVSTMVATKVVQCFGELSKLVDKFYIIAGNHDYYSPTSNEVNTLDLMFRNLNITLVTNRILDDGDDLLIPWYEYGNPAIQKFIDTHGIKRIFVHADIVNEKIPYKGVEVYSGHVHIPNLDWDNGLYNLGSCYALDFGDSNNHRGFHTLTDGKNLKFHPNTQSINYWRLYDEDIFDVYVNNSIKNGDYIEVYVSESNMSVQKYVERLNDLTKLYKNIWIIPKSEQIIAGDCKFEGYDIEKIIAHMIPEELKAKFDLVLNSLKSGSIIK